MIWEVRHGDLIFADGEVIGVIDDPDIIKQIVHEHNTFDELVEALDNLVKRLDDMGESAPQALHHDLSEARELLAKAKGG